MKRQSTDRIKESNPESFFMRIITNFTLYVVISLLICFNVWADGTKGPSMSILEPVYDGREVQEGTIIDHTFRFKNDGDALLEIKKVSPG